MTESEWWECQNPQTILDWLRHTGTSSERKLTLFAVALCRRVQHLLTNHHVRHSRAAIDVWERYADGLARREELQTATRGTKTDAIRAADAIAHPGEADCYAISFAAEAVEHAGDALASARAAAQAVAYEAVAKACDDTVAAVAASWRAQGYLGQPQWHADEARVVGTPAFRAAHDTECAVQCNLLRDIFAFREVHIDSSVLTWNDSIVARMAAGIYEERSHPSGVLDNARLAILADALEEAGCQDEDILRHARQQEGMHVRGCWLIDLLLRKM
jgi:hypothetical protein